MCAPTDDESGLRYDRSGMGATTGGSLARRDQHLVVAANGAMAAYCDGDQIEVVALPGLEAGVTIAADPDAVATELEWLGNPPRLLVVSRYPDHTTLYLVEVEGPSELAELRLAVPAILGGVIGPHALLIGVGAAGGASVVTMRDNQLVSQQVPTRVAPSATGAAGALFIAAIAGAGALEEWDPASRQPRRRFKLPRPALVTAVGGSDRLLWITTALEPALVETIPLVNRGQARSHALPEPIAQVAGHPRSDVIACLGADSGQVWTIDLEGRTGPRVLDDPDAHAGVPTEIALVTGRSNGLLLAGAGRALAFVSLDELVERRLSATVGVVSAATPGPAVAPATGVAVDPVEPGPADRSAGAGSPPGPDHGSGMASLAERLARLRRVTAPGRRGPDDPDATPARAPTGSAAMATPAPTAALAVGAGRPDPGATPPPREADAARSRWRDELVRWGQRLGEDEVAPGPAVAAIHAMSQRLGLDPALEPCLALLYAGHLLGRAGAAPYELARLGGWDEALGRGLLAARGIVVHRDSRVWLAPEVTRALDELPAMTGVEVGAPGPVPPFGPCVIVHQGPLRLAAMACAEALGGAVLAASDGADPRAALREARVRGATALVPVAALPELELTDGEAVVLAAVNDAEADALGLPRLY